MSDMTSETSAPLLQSSLSCDNRTTPEAFINLVAQYIESYSTLPGVKAVAMILQASVVWINNVFVEFGHFTTSKRVNVTLSNGTYTLYSTYNFIL